MTGEIETINDGAGALEFMIVHQNPGVVASYPGVVCSYDSSRHILLMTEDDAQAHAKALAISHPGTTYAVVRVYFSITHTKRDAANLRATTTGHGRVFGDLYKAAGAIVMSNGKRFLG